MNTINDRLRELRKYLKMNQEDFGKLLGISKSGVCDIENERRNVTEQHIIMLKMHDVNENWLRTGDGNMLIDRSKNEEISNFVQKLLEKESDSFQKRFISMLAKLKISDWEVLEKMVIMLSEQKKD